MATQSTPIPRPYRDYLVPRLHERFSKTALYTIPACYAASVCMSSWGMFMWLPYGTTVLRTLLLLISVLMVLVVRISNLHIGARNAKYPIETAISILRSFRWFHTFFWYSLSAWLFSEVYIFSAADNMALGWIDKGKSYERPKLNERPIYVRTMFILLALAQTTMHLFRDYDHTPLPREEPKPAPRPLTDQSVAPPQPSRLDSYLPAISKSFHNILNAAPWRIGYLVLATAAYFVPLVPIRWIAIKIHYVLAQQVPGWRLPRDGDISSFKEKGSLIIVTIFYALLMNLVWESCNLAFSVLVVQPPLKAGKPLTAVSSDPNLALLVGLKAKRELVRNMAFWELALLTKDFPERRKTIFAEVDRVGDKGSSWSQILAVCSNEIASIDERVNPPPPAVAPQAEVQALPRISDQGVANDNISGNPAKSTATYPSALVKPLGNLAKSLGQSPGASPPFVPQGKKLIESIPDSRPIQDLNTKWKDVPDLIIHSWVGWPFRQTFKNQANTIIHGAPLGREWSIRNAATALSHLVTHSVKEDLYGKVQADVATVIRLYVKTITATEGYLKDLQPHWTDVNFKADDRKVNEVLETLHVLKSGLEQVLGAFAEYMGDLELTMGEVAEAKRAASPRV